MIRRRASLSAAGVPAQVDITDLDVIERRAIERVMREANGNKVQASRQLGISRMQLYGRLRKYGLETQAGRRRSTGHRRRPSRPGLLSPSTCA